MDSVKQQASFGQDEKSRQKISGWRDYFYERLVTFGIGAVGGIPHPLPLRNIRKLGVKGVQIQFPSLKIILLFQFVIPELSS